MTELCSWLPAEELMQPFESVVLQGAHPKGPGFGPRVRTPGLDPGLDLVLVHWLN